MGSILHKRGTGVPAASALTVGELAIDQSTGKVYTKTTGGQVVEVGAGGGGGGGMGMKLTSQPATAGNFTHALKDTTGFMGYGGTMHTMMWESKGWRANNTPTNIKLTVPAGKKFLLQLIGSGSDRIDLLLPTMIVDGVSIYPAIDPGTFIPMTPTDFWPHTGYGKAGETIYRGEFADQPIIIESEMSFDIKVGSATASGTCRMWGFFVAA